VQIAVVGAGSFGTALAIHLARIGHSVSLWGRRPEHLRACAEVGHNTRFLSDVRFPDGLTAEPDLDAAFAGAELIVSAIPTKGVRAFWSKAIERAPAGAPIVNAAKGITTDSLETIDELMRDCIARADTGRLIYLSGPSFARELAEDLPTLLVCAGRNAETVDAVRDAFTGGHTKVYTSDDVVGVELGGALKNVIAIAVGIADGMATGHNARAGLITRGLHEMNRLATRYGANPLTLAGLAGMGDLVLTCTGDLSRNRRLGFAIGQGKTLDEAVAGLGGQIAEGYYTAGAVARLALRDGVDMPISTCVAAILCGEITPKEGMHSLLERDTRHERA
jgi:glycerol-3-phosphate dehydrogenase (NAD(P)+)